MKHELIRLADLIDWSSLAEGFGSFYSEEGRHPGKQFKRICKPLRTLKCLLGRVVRDSKRKASLEDVGNIVLSHFLDMSEKLSDQTKKSKNEIYLLHAPEGPCCEHLFHTIRFFSVKTFLGLVQISGN